MELCILKLHLDLFTRPMVLNWWVLFQWVVGFCQKSLVDKLFDCMLPMFSAYFGNYQQTRAMSRVFKAGTGSKDRIKCLDLEYSLTAMLTILKQDQTANSLYNKLKLIIYLFGLWLVMIG